MRHKIFLAFLGHESRFSRRNVSGGQQRARNAPAVCVCDPAHVSRQRECVPGERDGGPVEWDFLCGLCERGHDLQRQDRQAEPRGRPWCRFG